MGATELRGIGCAPTLGTWRNFININEYSPKVLSYLGDCVFELMVREKLVKAGNIPPEKLHLNSLLFVKATRQSAAVEKLIPILSEDELAAYKRGRNSKSTAPKSASVREYKRATGLECLFGYLYLLEQKERLDELFRVIAESMEL